MEALLENLLEKIEHNGLRFGGRIPECHMEYDGKYRLGSGGGWTDSFWVGIFYLAYAYTGQEKYLALADGYQDFFRRRIVNTEESNQENGYLKLDHDVGFLFSITQAARYRLTRDPEAKEIALKAANVLMERYHEKGGFIRAWDTWKWETDQEFIREKKGKVIIDSMMNLPLLFWAYQETGGEEYYRVAKTHADTVMRYMVRGDGSTYHTYNFDPETGAPLQGRTRQGYSDQSCWSRGQAWAIYGFGLAFEATKDSVYLETAKKTAEYYVSHLGAGQMPAWDFAATHQPFCPWDSSAAAIAAAGVAQLARQTVGEESARYQALAEKLLDSLTKLCGTQDFAQFEPFLLHGSIGPNYQEGTVTDAARISAEQGLVYGDYFYFEALLRLESPEFHPFWL